MKPKRNDMKSYCRRLWAAKRKPALHGMTMEERLWASLAYVKLVGMLSKGIKETRTP